MAGDEKGSGINGGGKEKRPSPPPRRGSPKSSERLQRTSGEKKRTLSLNQARPDGQKKGKTCVKKSRENGGSATDRSEKGQKIQLRGNLGSTSPQGKRGEKKRHSPNRPSSLVWVKREKKKQRRKKGIGEE